MPTLNLQGKWMLDYGFSAGTLVSVEFTDSCLTLTANPTATNSLSTIQVTSKLVRKRPREMLQLDWWLLRKYGFLVGDRIGLHIMNNKIQLTKINRYTTALD